MSIAFETKLAMFRAAVAAQCAGEPYVTGNRIVGALLRAGSVGEFLSRAQIDSARVFDAVEDRQTVSFEECERRVRADLASNGLEFASNEHQASVQLRPIEPLVRGVFDAVMQRPDQLGISPLELLLDLIRADPALAERLAPHGLDAASLSGALDRS